MSAYNLFYSDEYAKREEFLMGRKSQQKSQPRVRGLGFSEIQCHFCVVIYSIVYSDPCM